MTKYLVKCKISVYHEAEVDAEDPLDARDLVEGELAELVSDIELPNSLEWEGLESWEVEELND